MRPSAIYFAIFTLGASGALAQGVSSLPMRQAPIGHRQPAPSDLPPDVRKDEQRSLARRRSLLARHRNRKGKLGGLEVAVRPRFRSGRAVKRPGAGALFSGATKRPVLPTRPMHKTRSS
jgi:hypothetical protein